jgi:hypothetical protein
MARDKKKKKYYSANTFDNTDPTEYSVKRRGSKTTGYLAPGDNSKRHESGTRARRNPDSPGYQKKDRDIIVSVNDAGGADIQRGGKNPKSISENRANRIIDRYGRKEKRRSAIGTGSTSSKKRNQEMVNQVNTNASNGGVLSKRRTVTKETYGAAHDPDKKTKTKKVIKTDKTGKKIKTKTKFRAKGGNKKGDVKKKVGKLTRKGEHIIKTKYKGQKTKKTNLGK